MNTSYSLNGKESAAAANMTHNFTMDDSAIEFLLKEDECGRSSVLSKGILGQDGDASSEFDAQSGSI